MIFFDESKLEIGLKNNPEIQNMLTQMEKEVVTYHDNFSDTPEKTSAWGHHYFCKKDGNVLTYNPNNEDVHQCSLCGEEYTSPLLTRVWRTIYRNEAAVNVLKSAVLYKVTQEKKYLDVVLSISNFYFDTYTDFKLHNKEDNFYEDIEDFGWGSARIMPQCLNESIFFIRIFTALELVKTELPKDMLEKIENKFSHDFFMLAKPQVNKVHNISCWLNSAIGVIGLFANNEEMIRFTFEGEYNINRQLREGVTADGFWYEGSIHYNFFTLEGVSYLALFSQRYEHSFEEEAVIKKMLISAYNYAFSNHELPNPNDGWPNINLKTYSYIYAIGAKLFGVSDQVYSIFKDIISSPFERGEIPLSKPYYYNNDISLEQLLLMPEVVKEKSIVKNIQSVDMEKSNYALLKNNNIDVFMKYGHNGPSHAHPDKMTIEVLMNNITLSRDLSNSGYGSMVCNEWHRKTVSHNTVVIDGGDHTSFEQGQKLAFSERSIKAKAVNIVKGVDFIREIKMLENGFNSVFTVESEDEHVYDHIFHVEAKLQTNLEDDFEVIEPGTLDFQNNGYQYFKDIKEIKVPDNKNVINLEWDLDGESIVSDINVENHQIFIAQSPSNPISDWRTSLILRTKGTHEKFVMEWRTLK
ncbi:Heparinase II/III-like protein [Halolactibacillus halophilus]|uniref:Heparinase II/III-like protein n=1 Tax=Halolactibacillus halophilus TaxID=306540 RepID=A0A1I5RHV0_9BACI|nr:heparinase II/III family protein [Halolactibacillus halophilus]GEM02363.1 hypothetical protein HHA03_18950 [Halolactibacillus halophilus]SFP58082.1 Heparinase II/III-like protein [Halolactibacillus halophilus]